MRRFPIAICLLAIACLGGSTVRADLLTFETTPAGTTPVDDTPLASPYSIPGGTARFFFDINENGQYDPGIDASPVLEQSGQEAINGFFSTFSGISDTPRPGFESELGNFALRKPADVSGPLPPTFVVLYDTTETITALSGEIWDIDGTTAGTEQWRIDVLDSSQAVLASTLSPMGVNELPSSLDSLPWIFQFEGLPVGVSAVRIKFIGTKTTGAGLAFNNFSPDVAIPEPGTAMIAAFVAALAAARRRQGIVHDHVT